jgi:hypothetical protein
MRAYVGPKGGCAALIIIATLFHHPRDDSSNLHIYIRPWILLDPFFPNLIIGDLTLLYKYHRSRCCPWNTLRDNLRLFRSASGFPIDLPLEKTIFFRRERSSVLVERANARQSLCFLLLSFCISFFFWMDFSSFYSKKAPFTYNNLPQGRRD